MELGEHRPQAVDQASMIKDFSRPCKVTRDLDAPTLPIDTRLSSRRARRLCYQRTLLRLCLATTPRMWTDLSRIMRTWDQETAKQPLTICNTEELEPHYLPVPPALESLQDFRRRLFIAKCEFPVPAANKVAHTRS